MGFFAEFWAWLSGILAAYIGVNTARVAAILEPMVLALGTLYVLIWGYLQLSGKIEEPLMTGLKRIFLLALVFGAALRLWLYNAVIVDTFLKAPAQFAAAVIGAFDPVGIIDQILLKGSDAAGLLLEKSTLLDWNIPFLTAGFAVYVVVGLTAVYAMFLLALSRIALSVLLALGPLLIVMLLFESTKRFFESWIAQLANYAFITILTVMVAALMMQLIDVAATQAAARGDAIDIAEAVRVCLAAGLVFLVMRQVMPMAASLSHGLSLSTFGTMSALIGWGLGRSARNAGQFGRGLIDKDTSRYDSLSRKAGFYVKRSVAAGMGALGRRAQTNSITKRDR
jgi:type IV secretion system protein VirB6